MRGLHEYRGDTDMMKKAKIFVEVDKEHEFRVIVVEGRKRIDITDIVLGIEMEGGLEGYSGTILTNCYVRKQKGKTV